jgi:hypothetical protein
MSTFKVLLKRIAYAEVIVEAESAAEVKRLLADDDTSFEFFTSSGNTWYGPDIKVQTVKRATETA